MTAAPSHIQAHGRDRQFEDPCRQKNERAGFRPIRHKLVSLNLAGKQHVGQNGSDSTHDKTRRRRLCDNGERSISHTSRQTREQRRRPLEYKGERIPEGDARKKPNRVERPGAGSARRGNPPEPPKSAEDAEAPPNAASAALKYSTVFAERRSSYSFGSDASSGALSTPATMPASGVPNMAATLAAIVASPIAPARRPARLRRSRSRQHADAMRPVKPASGPTEPPNTIGSKKPTTDLPAPSTR